MHVWESIGTGKLAFNSEDINCPAIAHIVENTVLKSQLASQLNTYPSLKLLPNTSVESITRDISGNSFPFLTLNDKSTLRTRLLVGADGLQSKVRQFAAIETKGWDYNQKGVVATLKLEAGYVNETAWQRFLPDGPIALLPVKLNRKQFINLVE